MSPLRLLNTSLGNIETLDPISKMIGVIPEGAERIICDNL